jgi:phosphotransferase system enzyme I (PtsP)
MPTPGLARGPRSLLRQIREVMASGGTAQARLDQVARIIARSMVAEVCSIYLRRASGDLELFATEGLDPSAVHLTRLKPGEGLVGEIVRLGRPLALSDAPLHPAFSYRPETGEDPFHAFLGVPLLRGGRTIGAVVVQNRTERAYGEDEVEDLQIIAMVLSEMVAGGELVGQVELKDVEIAPHKPERLRGQKFADGLAIGRGGAARGAGSARAAAGGGHGGGGRPAAAGRRKPEGAARRDAGGPVGADRRAGRGARDLPDVRARPGLEPRAAGGGALRPDCGGRGGARPQRAPRAFRPGPRPLPARPAARLRGPGGPAAAPPAGAAGGVRALPENAVLIARNLGPADLLEYDRSRLKGLLLEEGSAASHAAIVARALGIPCVGRLQGLRDRLSEGDAVIVDGESGEAFLRPRPEQVESLAARLQVRLGRRAEFARLRDTPAVTLDGAKITLLMNAGLAVDLEALDDTGAEGIGLFRTEFQFMVAEELPRLDAQTQLYTRVLEAARGGR